MRGCVYRTIDDVCMKNSKGTAIVCCKSPCDEQVPEAEENPGSTGLQPFDYAVFKLALETYGAEAQEKMLLEEMAELQKEICKHWRGKDNVIEIAEEMADLSIMMDQMKIRFEIFGTFNQARKFKIQRLLDRLEERADED